MPSKHKTLDSVPSVTLNQAGWLMLVIPALERWRQADQKFKVILDHM